MSDSAANICKATGNLTKFQSELAQCRTSADVSRINNVLSAIDDSHNFFSGQFAQFNDLITTGDKFYGSSAASTVITEVAARNQDLNQKLQDIQNKNRELQSTAERHERDFLDVKGNNPEAPPTQRLNVLDDYTMMLLTISYLLMALSIVFYYAQVNNYTISSIALGSVGMAIISCILYVLAQFML
jgi:hypothetical protein